MNIRRHRVPNKYFVSIFTAFLFIAVSLGFAQSEEKQGRHSKVESGFFDLKEGYVSSGRLVLQELWAPLLSVKKR